MISHEAQVMIETYKDAQPSEGLLFSSKGGGHPHDEFDDESSDEEKSKTKLNESSFNLKTLNIKDLKSAQMPKRELL